MTAEEYAIKQVNNKDNSSYSQHVKNRISMFDGYDLQDAFEAGQEEIKNKAVDSFCNVNCNKLSIDCPNLNKCGGYIKFIKLLKK